MTQRHHAQFGLFHVTTNTRHSTPWCTWTGVPEILIDNLCMTRNLHGAKVHAFCILPNHMHMIVIPGRKGLSAFMQSFKRNSSWHIRNTVATIHESSLRSMNVMRWQHGFHDERIRDDRQRSAAFSYVTYNAMRHGLVENIDDWPWTSLHRQEMIDPFVDW